MVSKSQAAARAVQDVPRTGEITDADVVAVDVEDEE